MIPELPALLEKLRKSAAPLSKYAFNRSDVLGVGSSPQDFGKNVISAINAIKKTYVKMLKIINEAIDVLEAQL